MGYYGMDSLAYPGDNAMTAWRSQTPLKYCGYYLAPAPNRPTSPWMGKRAFLKSLNWGFLIVYVGRQEGQSGLTTTQATADGQSAVNLANQEGFPSSAIIFLDVEQGGTLSSAFITYISSWCKAVTNAGYLPGVYCSHTSANQIKNALTVNTQFWVFNISTGVATCANPFPNPNSAPDPGTTSGVSYAVALQYLQNCPFSAAGYSISAVDFDSATSLNPSRG